MFMQKLTPRAARLAMGMPLSTIAAGPVQAAANVGVLAMETYFPQRFVCQTKLEGM